MRNSNASLGLGSSMHDSATKLNVMSKSVTQMEKRHSEVPKANFFSMATVIEKSPNKKKKKNSMF